MKNVEIPKLKDVFEGLLGASFAIAILMGLNSMVYPMITNIFGSTAFLEPANIMFAILFFGFGLSVYAKYVKRKIGAIELINIMLITIFFASLITLALPTMVLVYELTITGIAVFLSAIFLGLSGSKAILKKLKI